MNVVVIEKRAGVVATARGSGRVYFGSSTFLRGASGSRRCSNDSRRSSRRGLLSAGANRNNDDGRRSSLRSSGRGNDDNAAGRRGGHRGGSLASRLDRGRRSFLGMRRVHRAARAMFMEGVDGSKRHASRSDGNGNPLLDNLGGEVDASILENGAGRGHESARGGENQRALHFRRCGIASKI